MNYKNSSLLKLLGIILAAILGLGLIHCLVIRSGYGVNIGYRGILEGGHFNMGYGYGYGFAGGLSFLLLLLIKVLFVLFIVGLVVGIALAIKKYIFTAEDVDKIKSAFTGKKTVVIKETCSICGKELEQGWKLCPHCGKEIKS